MVPGPPGTARALTLPGGTDAVLRADISGCGTDCRSLGGFRRRGGRLTDCVGVVRDRPRALHYPLGAGTLTDDCVITAIRRGARQMALFDLTSAGRAAGTSKVPKPRSACKHM